MEIKMMFGLTDVLLLQLGCINVAHKVTQEAKLGKLAFNFIFAELSLTETILQPCLRKRR